MRQRTRSWLAFAIGAAIPLVAIGVAFLLLILNDLRKDKQHVVIVHANTPVFTNDGNDGRCRGTPLTTVGAGMRLAVRRISYLKDCAVIDVVLPDGRKAYVVLGQGDFLVQPPLHAM